MMGLLSTVIGTFWGKIGVAVFAGFLAFKVNNSIQQSIGAKGAKAEVVRESRKQGAERNAKARTIRNAAQKPGSPERLLRDYCRDCD